MRLTSAVVTYVGVAVTVAGFALIAFAWGQTAGLEAVSLQVPYVVSGGLPGLGLILVGLTAVNVQAKRVAAAAQERRLETLAEIMQRIAVAVGASETPDAAGEGSGRVDDTSEIEPVDPARANPS